MTTAYGYDHKHFISAQSSIATQAIPATGDAFKVHSALQITREQKAEIRNDFQPDTLDPMNETPLGVGVTWSIDTTDIYGSGTQGTAVDWSLLLTSAFTEDSVVATTVDGTPTTSTLHFAADNVDAGDFVRIDCTSGGVVVERRYAYVVSKTNPGLVCTIYPPLTNAPTVGDTAYAIKQYALNLTNTDYFQLRKRNSAFEQSAWGCKAGVFTFTFEKGQTAKMAVEGIGRDCSTSGVGMRLAEALDDSETGVDVDGCECDAGALLLCESEAMRVISISGNTLTVERGFGATAAAAHDTDLPIIPYDLSETTAGTPILSLYGGLWIGTSGTFIKADSVTVKIDTKPVIQDYLGDEGFLQDVKYAERREISIEFTGHYDDVLLTRLRTAVANTPQKVFVQAGQAAGLGMAFYFPAVQFNPETIPDVRNDTVKATISSRVVFGSAGEDAVKFAF